MFYNNYKEIKKAYKNMIMKSYNFIKNQSIEEIKSSYLWSNGLTQKQKQLKPREQKKLLLAKELKAANKKIELFNEKCDTIAKTEPVKWLHISVNWSKNKTWGMNPHAETRTGEYHTGSASGCGYDKLSSAIANALNQDYKVLKRLYNRFEEALRKNKNIRDFVGYGSGYTIPYFEGGVGYSSFRSIFKNLGAKVNTWNEGKIYDDMIIEW